MPRELYIVGMPLDEKAPLSAETVKILDQADLIIGESRNLTDKRLKTTQSHGKPTFFLDNIRPADRKELSEALSRVNRAALFSDHGLPCLFDPGVEIVEECRTKGFRIRTSPGPASWAVAAAASLFAPPFLLWGFPPQKTEDREKFFVGLKQERSHVVLLETPYRFRALLSQMEKALGKKRRVFLAWELGLSTERLFWGTLEELSRFADDEKLEKGELVLILESLNHAASRLE